MNTRLLSITVSDEPAHAMKVCVNVMTELRALSVRSNPIPAGASTAEIATILHELAADLAWVGAATPEMVQAATVKDTPL